MALTNGCIANWRLNDNADTNTVVDILGNHNGTYHGTGGADDYTSAHSVAGKINTALDFDGTQDYISIVDHADFDLTTVLSVFAWAKNDNAAIASAQDFISKSDENGDKREWFMQLTTAEKFRLVISSDGTSVDRFDVLTDDVIAVDSWRFYGFTFDNDTIILYVDGVAVDATESRTGSGGINNDISPVAIGASYTNSGIPTLGGFWDGNIDGVMIFNRAISLEEVKRLYNSGHGTEILSEFDDKTYVERWNTSWMPLRKKLEV